MTLLSEFKAKVASKSIVLGIIGLGYVGLPIIKAYCNKGIKTIGFDINKNLVNALNQGVSHVEAVSSAELSNIIAEDFFQATTNFSLLSKCDVILICVPTPIDKHHTPDLSYIESSARSIAKEAQKGQLISLESTTYPGTTEEILIPIIEKEGLKAGKDIFIAYSPERENPGFSDYNFVTIPKVISGHTVACLEAANSFYGLAVEKIVPVSSLKTAEMTKLLENIYRCVNISLVNELKIICDKMNIDIREAINAAATKPFGFKAFYPGPGIGGHCIPVDPFYLTYKAKEFGIHTRFIELAGEINFKVQDFVTQKTILSLNKIGKAINNSKILIIGLAYKKNVSDMRESPSIGIIKKLYKLTKQIDYHDHYIAKLEGEICQEIFKTERKSSSNLKNVSSYDAVLLLTDHDGVDYNFIQNNAKLIIDTRGVFAESEYVIKA